MGCLNSGMFLSMNVFNRTKDQDPFVTDQMSDERFGPYQMLINLTEGL